MPINTNWKARFLLRLVGAVKVSRLQRLRANLSNRVIGGRYMAKLGREKIFYCRPLKKPLRSNLCVVGGAGVAGVSVLPTVGLFIGVGVPG